MSELSTTFNQLHLAGTTDGDFRADKLVGLSRLSPFVYIGGSLPEMATVGGYYDCPALAQFRVAVREVGLQVEIPQESSTPDDCAPKNCIGTHPVRPNMFDLDTRNLYFGSLNQSPKLTHFHPGQGTDGGDSDDPVGKAIKGLPMRLQQVHFRAFYPQGESDEYSAYFLASNPVGPFRAKGTTVTVPEVVIDSDFNLQKLGTHLFWTHNEWTINGSEETAVEDFGKRLIIGDPIGVEEKKLKWKEMYEDDVYEDLATRKRNVYNIILDGDGLIVRQTKPEHDSAATEGENTVPGWKYQVPMDVIIANRYRFALPKGKSVSQGDERTNKDADHLVMEYYDKGDEFQEDKILRRPAPKKGHVIGCENGKKWEAIPGITYKTLCNLFPRLVTSVVSTGQGLYENYVEITCYGSGPDAELIVTPGSREIISFTDCKDGYLSSTGSGGSGSSDSDSSSSTSSSSTSYSSQSSSSDSSSSTSSCYSESSGEIDCGKCPGAESDTSGSSS